MPTFVLNLPESDRRYSNFYKKEVTKGSSLDLQGGYWIPFSHSDMAANFVPGQEYVEILLQTSNRPSEVVGDGISGLITQGRENRSNWVTELKVTYSLDHGESYHDLGIFKNENGPKGNKKNIIVFESPIEDKVTNIRVYPMKYHGDYPALRLAVMTDKMPSEILTGDVQNNFLNSLDLALTLTENWTQMHSTAVYEDHSDNLDGLYKYYEPRTAITFNEYKKFDKAVSDVGTLSFVPTFWPGSSGPTSYPPTRLPKEDALAIAYHSINLLEAAGYEYDTVAYYYRNPNGYLYYPYYTDVDESGVVTKVYHIHKQYDSTSSGWISVLGTSDPDTARHYVIRVKTTIPADIFDIDVVIPEVTNKVKLRNFRETNSWADEVEEMIADDPDFQEFPDSFDLLDGSDVNNNIVDGIKTILETNYPLNGFTSSGFTAGESYYPEYVAMVKKIVITPLPDTDSDGNNNPNIDTVWGIGGVDVLYNTDHYNYSYRNDTTRYTGQTGGSFSNPHYGNGMTAKGSVTDNHGNRLSYSPLVEPWGQLFTAEYAASRNLDWSACRRSGNIEVGFLEEVPFTEIIIEPINTNTSRIICIL